MTTFLRGRRILKQKAHTFLCSQSLLVSILIYTIRYSQWGKKFFLYPQEKCEIEIGFGRFLLSTASYSKKAFFGGVISLGGGPTQHSTG